MQRPDVCTQRVKAMCSDTCWYFVTSTALRNSKIQEQFWPQRYPKKIWPWAPLGFLLGNSCQPWRLPMKHPILRRLMHSTGGCASRNGGCWACAEGGRWGGGVTFLVGSKQSEPPPRIVIEPGSMEVVPYPTVLLWCYATNLEESKITAPCFLFGRFVFDLSLLARVSFFGRLQLDGMVHDAVAGGPAAGGSRKSDVSKND